MVNSAGSRAEGKRRMDFRTLLRRWPATDQTWSKVGKPSPRPKHPGSKSIPTHRIPNQAAPVACTAMSSLGAAYVSAGARSTLRQRHIGRPVPDGIRPTKMTL
jgi:hypothetical protein